jgi:hypothetical protein
MNQTAIEYERALDERREFILLSSTGHTKSRIFGVALLLGKVAAVTQSELEPHQTEEEDERRARRRCWLAA